MKKILFQPLNINIYLIVLIVFFIQNKFTPTSIFSAIILTSFTIILQKLWVTKIVIYKKIILSLVYIVISILLIQNFIKDNINYKLQHIVPKELYVQYNNDLQEWKNNKDRYSQIIQYVFMKCEDQEFIPNEEFIQILENLSDIISNPFASIEWGEEFIESLWEETFIPSSNNVIKDTNDITLIKHIKLLQISTEQAKNDYITRYFYKSLKKYKDNPQELSKVFFKFLLDKQNIENMKNMLSKDISLLEQLLDEKQLFTIGCSSFYQNGQFLIEKLNKNYNFCIPDFYELSNSIEGRRKIIENLKKLENIIHLEFNKIIQNNNFQ